MYIPAPPDVPFQNVLEPPNVRRHIKATWRSASHYCDLHRYIYIYMLVPPQDLSFEFCLPCMHWSEVTCCRKVRSHWGLSSWIWLLLWVLNYSSSKNNTHPFGSNSSTQVLHSSFPVWHDSSTFIKVCLHKTSPFSIKPIVLIQPFPFKLLGSCSSLGSGSNRQVLLITLKRLSFDAEDKVKTCEEDFCKTQKSCSNMDMPCLPWKNWHWMRSQCCAKALVQASPCYLEARYWSQ